MITNVYTFGTESVLISGVEKYTNTVVSEKYTNNESSKESVSCLHKYLSSLKDLIIGAPLNSKWSKLVETTQWEEELPVLICLTHSMLCLVCTR